MNGPSFVFFTIVTLVTFAISFLSLTLAQRLFALYRGRKITRVFWTVNILLMAAVLFGRGRLDIFPFSATLIQLVVMWFMFQVCVLVLTPFYFVLIKGAGRMFSGTSAAVDVGRRRLIKGAALSLPAASLGISAYGTFYASREIHLRSHDIFVPDLDATVENFKIAQLSDVHLGLFFSVRKLRDTLAWLAAERPDVLMITGDLIDDLTMLEKTVEALNEFAGKFPKGIYFSWGNHEYFRNFPLIQQALENSAVHVLRNQNARLVDAAKPLYVLGVDYPWSKDSDAQKLECERMMEAAARGVPAGSTQILMSHHPALIDYAYESGIALSLTGHTHGGQVAVLGHSLLPVRYKYMRGMYRDGRRYGYVSTGAGSWFPFRLGCPAEIAVFTLKKARD